MITKFSKERTSERVIDNPLLFYPLHACDVRPLGNLNG